MRPVVLDGDQFKVVLRRKFVGEAGREEPGVEIVGYHIKLRPEQSPDVRNRLLQVLKGRGVAHVADMR